MYNKLYYILKLRIKIKITKQADCGIVCKINKLFVEEYFFQSYNEYEIQ